MFSNIPEEKKAYMQKHASEIQQMQEKAKNTKKESQYSKLALWKKMEAAVFGNELSWRFFYPTLVSEVLQTLDELQSALDPPYSDGFLKMEIHVAIVEKQPWYWQRFYKGIIPEILERMSQ